jgi:hypothetical protein
MENRYGTKCTIIHVNGNNRSAEADVLEFKEQKRLVVALGNAVKLHMTWNGKEYEGKQAGLDFVSKGPEIFKTTNVKRG